MVELRKDIPRENSKVHIAVTIAVAISLALVLTGIWNGYKTSLIAEESIKSSLELQQLSDRLRFHQDSMSSAIEQAVTTNESHWQNNYELSLLQLQETMNATELALSSPIIAKIKEEQQRTTEIERELFAMIEAGRRIDAFALFAADEYQDTKILLEQDALTLRASLDRRAKDIIVTLNAQLDRTTMALVAQIVLIIAIWLYVVSIVRRWQSHLVQHSEELQHLAHYDALTGIGNRALFQQRLEAAFSQSKRDHKPVGLILMDIDHFKDINDSLGHDIGDHLLIHVAEKLQGACRETDTVVRLGGDEFAIVATNLDRKRDSAVLGNKILSIFEKPLEIQGSQIKTGTSIGLAFFPDDAHSADELLRKADMALYEAKRNGRATFKFFDASIENAARHKAEMQADLQRALAEEEFELHYQPIIDIARNTVIGAESLLRWRHPRQGLISPETFIPIAEESRLIVPIGEWVLRNACEQQAHWESHGLPSMNIAVNLSAVQFNERKLIQTVRDIMQETGIRKNRLTLEITESTLMETEGDVIAKLHSLKALGLKLAIDDFGTGYSSLAYLKRFPIHHLKIDREFVKDLPEDGHDVAIARSIIKMAHELEISVVAEGIEEPEQLHFLREAECNYGQGYHFGKPMPAEEFRHWLQRFAQNSVAPMRIAK